MSTKATKEASGENEPSAVMARLSWQLALRDDAQVAQALYAGEEIEELHELSEAGLLDEFFVFLKDIGMLAVLEEALPLAERCLQTRAASPVAKAAAKTVLCVGLAKSGKLKEAVTAFQDSLQFARFGAGGLVGQAAGATSDSSPIRRSYCRSAWRVRTEATTIPRNGGRLSSKPLALKYRK